MAHEIEIDANGKASMFYVNDTPWHGLGTPLQDPPSVADAIKLAGLDWNVRTEGLYLADGRKSDAKATVRESDNSILGVVGPDYTVLQNSKAFDFFQPFVDNGQVSLEVAGALRQGSRIFVLGKVKVDPIEIVPGDPVLSYILLWNSHDGTLACGAGFSRIRVVCANTLSSALRDQASKMIRLRHTQNIESALTAVREAMNVGQREFVATAQQYRELARKGCNAKDLEKYVKLVFGVKPKHSIEVVEMDEDTEVAGTKRVMPKIVDLFENGKGSDIVGVKGTMWGALNAVSEYLGYVRGNNQENRLNNLWFGDSAKVNRKALDIALNF